MKKSISKFLILILVTVACTNKPSLDFKPELLVNLWPAKWIAPELNMKDYGVFHFIKVVVLKNKPEHFIVHVSADNRYILYVNGVRITDGPATGDIKHWQFETIDIAPFLKKDSNIISSVVWNYGSNKPWRQFTIQTAFIMQGNGEEEQLVNTDSSWFCMRDSAYEPCWPDPKKFSYGTGTGSYEKIVFNKYPWGWENQLTINSNWKNAVEISHGNMQNVDTLWTLVKRETPLMEYKEERISVSVKSTGIKNEDVLFFKVNNPLTILPNSKVIILLDKLHTTTAFPKLQISGGKGSIIKITYNESLYDDTIKLTKGNRSETKNKFMLGLFDIIYPDGGNNRIFEPLAYRTYRFIQFEISTSSQPLTIEDYKEHFSAYPFELKASFSCNDTILNQLFERGWRSVRLCSHDIYVDCPYYEQLQYFGDLNITTRISSYLSNDYRLVKQALLHGLYSMEGNEVLIDAYPQPGKIIIPSFALSWIDIIDFYNASVSDTAFVHQMIPGVDKIMNWYESKIDISIYLLGPMPHWNFVDCTQQWPWLGQIDGSCEPPGTKEGHSALLTLQYLYGLQKAESFYLNVGEKNKSQYCLELANKITNSLIKLCWDDKRNLIADIPSKTSFSQHANYMALATGIVPENKVNALIENLNKSTDLVQASLQFKAYYHAGLKRYNRLNNYTEMLAPWRELISMGCTTFPEYPKTDNRSETHAWTAFPVLEMITIICGIQPVSINSNSVVIEPHLGSLQWAEGSLPCKQGIIKVRLERKANKIQAIISIPEGMTGILKFEDKEHELKSGNNQY